MQHLTYDTVSVTYFSVNVAGTIRLHATF